MAEQEEPKNAGPGLTPTPVKLHTSGLAGTTQHLTPPVESANRTSTVPIAKSSSVGKPLPTPQASVAPAAPVGAEAAVREGDDDKTMRLKKNTSTTIHVAQAAPASPLLSPSAQTIKLAPAAPASPMMSPSAQTIKLTPSAAKASAQTIKLTPSAAKAPVQTIKLTPSAAKAPTQTIKLTPSAANASSQTIKLPENDGSEGAHTVKISRVSHAGLSPLPTPSSSAKPPSSIPGAKQTIKLRPSAMSSTVTAVPPTGGSVKLNAGAANKTIKLVPLGNGGAKVVPNGSSSPAAPAQQTSAAPSAPATQVGAPRTGQTLKLTPPASGVKPVGGKTMKLSLHKPVGAPPAAGKSEAAKVPALTPPSGVAEKKDKDEAAAVEEKQKPSIVFFLISIAAMLAIVFTILLMSVQYANMYSGADINIPGMTRLSGSH